MAADQEPLSEPLLPMAPPGSQCFASSKVQEALKLATKGLKEPLSEGHAFSIEQLWLQERQRFLAAAHGLPARPKLAIAFSGGGQRAASFACGVLWALAEKDLLPHVSHLSAVSGGGYAASAFASYLMGSGPMEEEALQDYYRRVTRDCLLNFQERISHLVRPSMAAVDVPAFVFGSLGSIMLSMLMVALHVAIPLAVFLEHDLGAVLREMVCYPPGEAGVKKVIIVPLVRRLGVLLALMALAMVFGIARRIIKPCRAPTKAPKKLSWSSDLPYLLTRSCRVMALRCFVIGTFYMVVVLFICVGQLFGDGYASGKGEGSRQMLEMCHTYLWEAANSDGYLCSDIGTWSGRVWYRPESSVFERTYLNETWQRSMGLLGVHAKYKSHGVHIFLWFNASLLLFALATAVFRSRLLNEFICVVGPLWAAWLVAAISSWMIFGPITGQPLITGGALTGSLRYSTENCIVFFVVCIVVVMASLPFYTQLQQGIHNFNVMKLRRAYYHKANTHWTLEEVSANPYCPHIILGSCLQDYSRPGDTEPYADFGLSPLFLGGRRTGYLPTAATRCRLAMAMGVSGGAVDMAMAVLSHKARWWIGLLGLQMGAWVRVRGWRSSSLQCFTSSRRVLLRALLSLRCLQKSPRTQELLEEMLVRGPGIVLQWTWHLVFLAVVVLDCGLQKDMQRCFPVHLYAAFIVPFLLIVLAVHLSFLPCCAPVLRSPVLRHILMIFNYNHRSWEVPEQLYLLDGGLVDSLGVLALLRRKERWMLATDAASPAGDPVRFIRECLEAAVSEKLCSFSSPEMPGRDMSFVLEDFRKDTSKPFLHLKVLYEPYAKDAEAADLFIISLRIPEGDKTPEHGLLLKGERPREIFRSVSRAGSRSDLLGACCFDGCHELLPRAWQGCCGSFPRVPMVNQFLTPRLFSEICCLGQELSSAVLEKAECGDKGIWLRFEEPVLAAQSCPAVPQEEEGSAPCSQM